MSLFWKDLEISPGMVLEIEQYYPEVYNKAGQPAVIKWKVLSFGSRNSDEAYLEYATGKKYTLKKVIKKRKLQAGVDQGKLLQLPAGSDFMVVQEYHDGEEVSKLCYNLDMLSTIRNIRVI